MCWGIAAVVVHVKVFSSDQCTCTTDQHSSFFVFFLLVGSLCLFVGFRNRTLKRTCQSKIIRCELYLHQKQFLLHDIYTVVHILLTISVHAQWGLLYLVCMCMCVCLTHVFSDSVSLHIERRYQRLQPDSSDYYKMRFHYGCLIQNHLLNAKATTPIIAVESLFSQVYRLGDAYLW